MFFQSWSDLIHMGGYGFYVWLSYGLSFIAIVALIIQSLMGKSAVLKSVEQQRESRLQQVQQKGETL